MQTRKHHSAFPLLVPEPSDEIFETGLTKREYFAAMAMHGILVNGFYLLETSWVDILPKKAVQIADEMILQLNKSSSNENQHPEE